MLCSSCPSPVSTRPSHHHPPPPDSGRSKRPKLTADDAAKASASVKDIFGEEVRTAPRRFTRHRPPRDTRDAAHAHLIFPFPALFSAAAATTTARAQDDDVKSKKSEKKKKSNLELFKEQLKVQQEQREARLAARRAEVLARTGDPNKAALVAPAAGEEMSAVGSYDTGDPTTTNIFVGHLPLEMDEQRICEVFGEFGPLASVKVMWPRTPAEHARNHMTGFIAFMKRDDAERAFDHYRSERYEGINLRLDWGKPVAIPPRPIFVSSAHAGPVETGLPFNARPRHAGSLDLFGATVKVCRGGATPLASSGARTARLCSHCLATLFISTRCLLLFP